MPIPSANPPETLKPPTRPEMKFETRRGVWIVALLLLVCAGGTFVLQSCSNPTKGVDHLLPTNGTPATANAGQVAAAPTAASGLNLDARFPGNGSAAQNAASTVPLSGLDCRTNMDVTINGYRVPNQARVRVIGYTAADGGRVEVAGIGDKTVWVSQNYFVCFDDVRRLEKPYFEEPTRGPSGTPTKGAGAVRVITVIVPGTPVPVTPVTTVVNRGIYWDGGCLAVDIQGVRAIYVDGQGVSVGRYCGVSELRVVVK